MSTVTALEAESVHLSRTGNVTNLPHCCCGFLGASSLCSARDWRRLAGGMKPPTSDGHQGFSHWGLRITPKFGFGFWISNRWCRCCWARVPLRGEGTGPQSSASGETLGTQREGKACRAWGMGERAGLWLVLTSFIFPNNVARFPP